MIYIPSWLCTSITMLTVFRWCTYTSAHWYLHICKTCTTRSKSRQVWWHCSFLGCTTELKLLLCFHSGIWHERATVCGGRNKKSPSSNFVFLGCLIPQPHPVLAQESSSYPGSLCSWWVVCSDYTAVAKLQEWNPSGCQEGQKEEDGFAWLNFILFSLKYWNNLFLNRGMRRKTSQKHTNSFCCFFQPDSFTGATGRSETHNSGVARFYFKPFADLSCMSPSFLEEILTHSELTCSCTNKCMTWERLRVDLND